ncbi:hypothetical protein MKW92_003369 [Papaver armeniacum]|nr:hypothetical protein MKW92_003369 [Papaver armeniacum]
MEPEPANSTNHRASTGTENEHDYQIPMNGRLTRLVLLAAKIVNNRVIDKEENIVEFLIEPHTGVTAVGLRKKSFLGIGIKIYGFGIYAETEKLKELLRSKINEVYLAAETNKEILVLVFPGITMSMVRKNFGEGLGASIKKLNGGEENNELTNMVMGEASNEIKLPNGFCNRNNKTSRDTFSKQRRVNCSAWAYFNMYLGDDVFDMDARERFGRIFSREKYV